MQEKFKNYIVDYFNSHMDPTGRHPSITKDDVIVVWYAYILGHMKALLTTNIPDGMYYECTYDRDKDVTYLDAYKRWDHKEVCGTIKAKK